MSECRREDESALSRTAVAAVAAVATSLPGSKGLGYKNRIVRETRVENPHTAPSSGRKLIVDTYTLKDTRSYT